MGFMKTKNIQIVRINKSILDYYKMVMDFDNESEDFRKASLKEFKDKLEEALNIPPHTNKKIEWVD